MEETMSAAAAWGAAVPAGVPVRGLRQVGGARPPRPRLVSVPTGEAVVAPVPGRLRVTRAGRLAVTLVVATAAVALLAVVLVGGGGSGGPAIDHSTTVRPGQTLSEVALQQLPQLPVAEAVAQIQLANGLSSSAVHAGQSLLIPAVG
jgi:LysM repeat protein